MTVHAFSKGLLMREMSMQKNAEVVRVELKKLQQARAAANDINTVLWGCKPTYAELERISAQLDKLRGQLDELVCDGTNELLAKCR